MFHPTSRSPNMIQSKSWCKSSFRLGSTFHVRLRYEALSERLNSGKPGRPSTWGKNENLHLLLRCLCFSVQAHLHHGLLLLTNFQTPHKELVLVLTTLYSHANASVRSSMHSSSFHRQISTISGCLIKHSLS